VKLTTSEIRLGRGALAELEASFHGRIIQPGDLDYHEYRAVWNGSIDRFPALIARCAGVADVIAAVSFAREAGLAIAVRGGGHGFPGLSICDGGIGHRSGADERDSSRSSGAYGTGSSRREGHRNLGSGP
jgi:FAD binding domain